jgi:O-methyltransferase
MTTPARCRHLWNWTQKLVQENVPGSFVECGVWKGGSSGVMALALADLSAKRELHLFDSFEGLPEPTAKDGALAAEYSGGRSSGELRTVEQCKAGLDEVEGLLFKKLNVDPKSVQFHVGWFQNTVPKDASTIGPIALLRLDGDWYESTRICLENLYPLLSPGGIVILDDYYAWEGCTKATDEFRAAHNISAPIQRIDVDAAFWVK